MNNEPSSTRIELFQQLLKPDASWTMQLTSVEALIILLFVQCSGAQPVYLFKVQTWGAIASIRPVLWKYLDGGSKTGY